MSYSAGDYENRLRLLGHVKCKDDGNWVEQCILVEIKGTTWRVPETPVEIVSRMKGLVYPMRMLRIKIIGEWLTWFILKMVYVVCSH